MYGLPMISDGSHLHVRPALDTTPLYKKLVTLDEKFLKPFTVKGLDENVINHL